MKKGFFSRVRSVLVVLALVGFASNLVAFACGNHDRIFFDSSIWKSHGDPEDATVRLKMIDDLQFRYKLVGMERTQLESLLGFARKNYKFGDYDCAYCLGTDRYPGVRIDYVWLCIKFENGIVQKADILCD